ncbi:MAG: hypothetical protein WAT09_06705 [Paracoccaceae bacterium]
MSTWISKTALILALAGCVAPGVRSSSGVVLGGAMTVAVPGGYCLDPSASHRGPDESVVIAGRCSSDSRALPAAITVSLGAEGSSAALKSGARNLTAWARSPAGRAALSRDGKAGSVEIRETLVSDGAFLIRLQDRGIGTYWRGAVGIKGRLVLISVTPPEGGTLSASDGRKILGQVVQTMRRANPAANAAP